MLSLINDILDFSKIETRQWKLEHTAFDLQGVVESVIDMLGVPAEMKDVELQVSRKNGASYPFATRESLLSKRIAVN